MEQGGRAGAGSPRPYPTGSMNTRYRFVKYTTTVCGVFVPPVAETVTRPEGEVPGRQRPRAAEDRSAGVSRGARQPRHRWPTGDAVRAGARSVGPLGLAARGGGSSVARSDLTAC